jgi:alkylation response protein AidB-like acyl-CoA dehydrogenase
MRAGSTRPAETDDHFNSTDFNCRELSCRDLNLLYTDVEDSLRASVRDLLTARCTPARVIATYDGDRDLEPGLWRSLSVDLGLAGLLVPEDRGGAGATAREAAAVLEELGRFVAPVPFLTSAVVATTRPVAWRGRRDRGPARCRWVHRRSCGSVLASATSFRATVRADEDGTLRGRVTSVAGALDADVLVVPVSTGDGVELHRVELHRVDAHRVDTHRVATAGTGVGVEPVVSLDMTRQLADVVFAGAPSTRVTAAETGDATMREALDVGAALLASEQLGVAQWCLDHTVAYLRERKQFGRPVGGFQAIKHRLADLYVMVESARAAARYAAATAAEDDPDRRVAACVAQAYCSQVAVKAAEECVQLHGGIGNDLGASGAPVPQARQGRPDRLRHCRSTPATPRRARGPAGQPTGILRRRNAMRPAAVTATATRVSQSRGAAENGPPGHPGDVDEGRELEDTLVPLHGGPHQGQQEERGQNSPRCQLPPGAGRRRPHRRPGPGLRPAT